MNKAERKYQFRERLSQVHPVNICDSSLKKREDEYELEEGLVIRLPEDCGDVTITGARDFCDFLFTSMNISARFTKRGSGQITIKIDPDYRGYKAFKVEVTVEGIVITAHDERGAAQGLYFLEEEMSARHAPYISFGITEREPLFSPRMVHSGYMLDEYPDSHLAQIAHAGMDAIIVMTRDTQESLWGYTDFNELIRRAAKWGLDVYAYSWYRSQKHPDDPGADAHYESTYGELFKQCPGFKGVILVGESVGFPSKDPNASPLPYDANMVNGIPADKPSADFWPCTDYREWLMKLQSIIYKYNPDADIVFWSYNWGYAPKEDRQRLIRNLPKGISMLVTYETYEPIPLKGELYEQVYDYSIAFAGPGEYFISEAEVAKECGIRLYTQANTAGNTWDMGGIPYEPMPEAWFDRAKSIVGSKEKYGLCGIMENHQYGFTPSIISEMVKYVYETGAGDVSAEMRRIIQRHYGFGQEEEILEALHKWSEAIRLLPPSGEEQTGAFRVGPSFPFSLNGTYKPQKDRSSRGYFMNPRYMPYNKGSRGVTAMSGVRLPTEKERLEQMLALLEEGVQILELLSDKNEEMLYLINLGHFMECIVTTGIHAKRWFIVANRLVIEPDNEVVLKLIQEADAILDAERENVLRALPLVQADSRLGWDPRMEYVCDPARIQWKLRLLDYVQKTELEEYRLCANYSK